MIENNHIPDLYLEKFDQGLLSSEEVERIEKLLENDEQLKQRINEIKLSNVEFRDSSLNSKALENIEIKVNEKINCNSKKLIPVWQYAGASLVACFLIFTFLPTEILLFTNNTKGSYSELGSEVRLKGMLPELSIYRKQEDYVEKIKNHQLVSNHDVLQLRYQGAGYQFGVIFSIDGRGEVTLHYPLDVNGSTSIQPEGSVALPYAYELDDAPNFERFFLLVSHTSLDVNEILKKGKALIKNKKSMINAQLEMQDGVYQASVIVSKEK